MEQAARKRLLPAASGDQNCSQEHPAALKKTAAAVGRLTDESPDKHSPQPLTGRTISASLWNSLLYA